MTLQIVHDYKGEWDIGNLLSYSEKFVIRTPSFFPLPKSNLELCFKASYEEHISRHWALGFKLKLVKCSSASLPSSFLPIIGVKINFSDEWLLKEYHSMVLTNFNQMNETEIAFKDFQFQIDDKIANQSLIIKCGIIFYDKIPSIHFEREANVYSKKYHDLIKNFKSVYNPSVLCDFVINVCDKTLPAHKVILAAHSPVFMKMMTNDFMESKTNSVTITDATPETFDLFLRYLYSGEMEDKSWSTLKELFYLAHKYDVEVLRNECTDVAISLLSVDLICDIIKSAYEYEDLSLKSSAKSFAINHIKELTLREDWKELVKTHPIIGYEVAAHFFPK